MASYYDFSKLDDHGIYDIISFNYDIMWVWEISPFVFFVFFGKLFCKACLNHSHKKMKDSLEGSLVRVLFASELEFPKILVPRLPQNTSNVKIESTNQKIKTTVLFAWTTSWSPDISSFYSSDINLFLIDYAWCKPCNKWLLLFEKNSRSLTLEEQHCCSYYSR